MQDASIPPAWSPTKDRAALENKQQEGARADGPSTHPVAQTPVSGRNEWAPLGQPHAASHLWGASLHRSHGAQSPPGGDMARRCPPRGCVGTQRRALGGGRLLPPGAFHARLQLGPSRFATKQQLLGTLTSLGFVRPGTFCLWSRRPLLLTGHRAGRPEAVMRAEMPRRPARVLAPSRSGC